MSRAVINLIIPGLLNLPAQELDAAALQPATPALHKLLRYARTQTATGGDFDDILLRRLGLTQAALPFAHALQPAQPASAVLFRPVHLKADINNAIVFPIEENSEDASIIINDLADFFNQDCDIEKRPDNSWLMHMKLVQPVAGVPHYLSALGKKVSHYLEQAKSNLDWFKLFNEMQMFMHQHAVNERRQQNGQPIINSLWCWGADQYGGEKLSATQWFSDEIELTALGQLYGADAYSLPALQSAGFDKDTIIVDLRLLKALKQNPEADLLRQLTAIEQECLSPVMQSRAKITLHTGAVLNFQYQPLASWRFWRKARSLTDL